MSGARATFAPVSFVPLQGPATLTVTHPPRDSEIEFTGAPGGPRDRVVRLPMRGAIPVLSRALRADDAHPSVGLLGGATVLALKLVAAGRIRVNESGDAWEAGPLTSDDTDAVRRLAQARAFDGVDPAEAEHRIRGLLDAVADTMTRTPVPSRVLREPVRRAARVAPAEDDADLPSDVTVSLRVEAPAEQLADGLVTVVLQVQDRADSSHLTDVAALWESADHGFSRRARLTASTELRRAAAAWPTLGRLLREPVPDRIVLTGDELADLLEHGVAALLAIGVDVFWPRGLRAELEPRGQVERVRGDSPLMTGLFGPDAMFAFDWRLALRHETGDEQGASPLTDAEMAALAAATTPIIRLRDNWVVIDPVLARKARRRVGRSTPVAPVTALRASLTGVLDVGGEEIPVHPGASLLRVRDRVVDAATVAPQPPPAGLDATLRDYQLRGLTWLAELTGAGLGACLADDMGLGKTVTLIALHLHRRERRLGAGPTLVVCPASLLGNWEAEIHRFAPGVPVRRFHGSSRDLGGFETGASAPSSTTEDQGFVLTTYGTMRRAHETLAAVPWDLVVADEAQHIKNATSSTARNLRTIESRARVALTGTPVENDLTELWAILDWATPGLLGSRAAFRKVWAAPIESGEEPSKARQFAQLVEPFLMRRRKSDPGIAPELPPKTETDQVVGLTREQVVLYEALVRESMERIEHADEDTRRGLVLALLTGLKQICNHPAHYLRQAAGRLRGRSEKLELLDELLGTILAEGGSVLLFTQYVAMARLLERHLAEAGITTLFLHGGTPVRAREQMVAVVPGRRRPGLPALPQGRAAPGSTSPAPTT